MSETCGAISPEGAVCGSAVPNHRHHTGVIRDGLRRTPVAWENPEHVAASAEVPRSKGKGDQRMAELASVVRERDRQMTQSLDAPHAYLPHDPAPTSVKAADISAVRNSERRKQVLAAIVALGEATDDEVCVRLADPNVHAGRVASRRGELEEYGWVEPVVRADGTPVERPTRTGTGAQVWRLTASGHRLLSEVDLQRA